MAKPKITHSPLGGMTVMVFKLEGDDATLQAGLKLVADTIARAMPANGLVSQRRPLAVATANGAAATSPPSSGDLHDEGQDGFDPEEENVLDVTEAPESGNSVRAKRKFPTMNLLGNLDLRPSDKKSLRDFFTEKSPKSQVEQLTVCTYYLCRILELPDVTPCHVYTAMKDVGKKTPNDMPQTLRNISSRKGWIDASNSDALKITNSGENFVEHDLPRTGSSS